MSIKRTKADIETEYAKLGMELDRVSSVLANAKTVEEAIDVVAAGDAHKAAIVLVREIEKYQAWLVQRMAVSQSLARLAGRDSAATSA